MILDFLDITSIDGKEWERICDHCYRARYQDVHFQKIPAKHLGDAGIEGFTHSGITYQCYCPEGEYDDNGHYEHLRDKMTTDIHKLVTEKNAAILRSLGITSIKEWHFVVPEYRDKRILIHANTKKLEVLKLKAQQPAQYDYIDSCFDVVIKVAEDYKVEISRLIRQGVTDKLNIATFHKGDIDWLKCNSGKLNNIKRKIKAVMQNVDDNDEKYQDVVKIYAEAYLIGIEIYKMLRIHCPDVYEDIYKLEQSYKREVEVKTKSNMDSTINWTLLQDILKEFDNKLRSLGYLADTSVGELKMDLVGGWLADCHMDFR